MNFNINININRNIYSNIIINITININMKINMNISKKNIEMHNILVDRVASNIPKLEFKRLEMRFV